MGVVPEEAVDREGCVCKGIHFGVPLGGFLGKRNLEPKGLLVHVVSNQTVSCGSAVPSRPICEDNERVFMEGQLGDQDVLF